MLVGDKRGFDISLSESICNRFNKKLHDLTKFSKFISVNDRFFFFRFSVRSYEKLLKVDETIVWLLCVIKHYYQKLVAPLSKLVGRCSQGSSCFYSRRQRQHFAFVLVLLCVRKIIIIVTKR